MVLSDRTLLLETAADEVEACREALGRFAELVKSPQHVHTYRVTPLSLWNAAARGVSADEVVDAMERFARYPVPGNVESDVRELMGRYGRLELTEEDGRLVLVADDPVLAEEVWNSEKVRDHLAGRPDETTLEVKRARRGWVKAALVELGWPPVDSAGYTPGEHMDVALRAATRSDGEPFALRDYQREALDNFVAEGDPRGGSGVVVLPCGAGKTVIGLAAIARMETSTLIVATNVVAARQWIDEILDKTTLTEDDVGEYTGDTKQIKPVTVATYQILTWRPGPRQRGANGGGDEGGEGGDAGDEDGDGEDGGDAGVDAEVAKAVLDDDGDDDADDDADPEFPHLHLFDARDWGLIIYDEVHLLPAPVFRVTAGIQAKHRLGLTATLVREDGRERDVFSLIGPKKYDAPWRELEAQGWIAEAVCTEVLVDLPPEERWKYAVQSHRKKARTSMENPVKDDVVEALVDRHLAEGDRILVIGHYLDQLHGLADRLDAPLLTGSTPNDEREVLYEAFRTGAEPLLVASKVANFSVDIPDANVAIQVSGTFGSRQEEAQRLGRILRPKDDRQAHFYTIVTRETRDQEFNEKRQLFLTEQGYRYEVVDAKELMDELGVNGAGEEE